MEIYTIGFTKKSAEQFFGLLKQTGIRRYSGLRGARQRQPRQLNARADAADTQHLAEVSDKSVGDIHARIRKFAHGRRQRSTRLWQEIAVKQETAVRPWQMQRRVKP